MSLRYGLLGVLCDREMTGYELDKLFKENLDVVWTAQTSQVYRELGKLEEEGLAQSRTVLQSDKPNKKIFSATERGRTEFAAWAASLSLEDELSVNDPYLLKLLFGGALDRETSLAAMKKFRYFASFLANGLTDDFIEQPFFGEEGELYKKMVVRYKRYQCEFLQKWADECLALLEGDK